VCMLSERRKSEEKRRRSLGFFTNAIDEQFQ
jgi:hypothetical protein